jgi:diguanylate cyclase (GGDEF)-like protein
LAFYDQLTNLPNRRLLLDRLQQAFTSSNRSRRKGALLFIDLDNFKTLNDTLGHDIGDLLLQQVAERLESCVREGDTVARLGGDEFVILLENLSKDVMEAASQAEVIGEKIINTLNQKYYLITHEHHNTPSIGITLFDEHQHSAEDLFKQADLAMYQSKKAGRNTLRFFDPKMQESINTQSSLESELRKAADEHQFQLYYQIQVDISNLPIGSEALIRWIHPERGLMLPMQFIPMAEESGLILSIGEWVLEAACEQLVKWSHHKETEHLIVAVNVSAHQFNQADFSDRVLEIIKRAGANPQRLKLEITESLLLNK